MNKWEFAKRHVAGKFIDSKGHQQDFCPAVVLMDDDLREEVHRELAPCWEQDFIEEYAKRHKKKFGEDFAPYSGGAW